MLFDKHGHSVNLINFPKGKKLSKTEKKKARSRLMKDCKSLSYNQLDGSPDKQQVPKWLAGALALAGGLWIFDAVKTADSGAH